MVLAARDGNTQAFTLLYRYYTPGLRRFAASLLPGIAQADDVVQNVWLKVGKRLHQLDDPRVFGSWLFRAVRWEALDWLKQSANQQHQPIEEADWQTTEEPTAYNVKTELGIAIAALPDIEREIIHLFYLQDMAVTQIALVLNIAPGTVKSRLHRARAALKQLLAEQAKGEY